MKQIGLILALLVLSGNLGFSQKSLNKFSDPVIQQIHDLADHRDALGLLPFLKDANNQYVGETLMVLGSVELICDSSVCMADTLFEILQSPIDGIRIAGAFALGQTANASSLRVIRKLLEKEEKPLVRGMLYDALGKTGEADDLIWLAALDFKLQESEGQAMGLFRFGMRGMVSNEGNDRMLAICAAGSSLAGLTYATYHLGKYAHTEWLQANAIQLRHLLDKERDPVIRSQLIKAVIKAEDEEAWPLVEYILKSDEDYRVKVNILSSLKLIPWNKVGKMVYDLAELADPARAIPAAEAIQKNAVYTDLGRHLKAIDKAENWRARATLLAKAMELVQGKKSLTKKVEKKLFDYYATAKNAHEKAWLLQALQNSPDHYGFLVKEIERGNAPVIATNAIQTLVGMRQSEAFLEAQKEALKKGEDLDQAFLKAFRLAISSEDVPMISIAAGALRDPALGYKEKITNLDFLKEALATMQQPEQVEARNELVFTLAYLMDRQIPKMAPPAWNHPIDWDRVEKTHPDQQLVFITNKGEVLVQLNLNWCPGTVSTFLELIESGYFNGKSIHRVVPNFVVQDGCPRGDGWGGPPFTIRSEFSPAPFIQGTLGMASAGKDTEGSQWYFTHSPTPHLDAKYTNFGYVISGLDVINKLEVGDVIEQIEILDMEQ